MNERTHRHLYFRKRFKPGEVIDPKMEGLCRDSAGPFLWAKRAGVEASDIARDNNPLAKQVGGSHYKDQKLQPIEACYKRYGYQGVKAALHCKIDKYLTRDKDEELEQLMKAQHCIELLLEYYKKTRENL